MWIIGDKKQGYSISRDNRYKMPTFTAYVWYKGDIARRDVFQATNIRDARNKAITYCHDRYDFHVGGGLTVHITRSGKKSKSKR